MESVWGEAKYVTIIHPFLLRGPDGAASDQAEVPRGSERPTTTLTELILAYLISFVKQNRSWARGSLGIGSLSKHRSCGRRQIQFLLLRKKST